jgi:hypothetical protein
MRDTKPKSQGFTDKQREFWSELRDYIHFNQAWVTSEPHTALVRFECLPGSILPDLMRRRGYDVHSAGTGERLLPVSRTVQQAGNVTTITTQEIVPTVVEIFEFKILF